MQSWIPIGSSSLYFWKSVFSFWVDSNLKWRVYIKLKVSWLPEFLWCMSQTSRGRVISGCVRTHEKISGDAVRRLGTIIQSIFCAQLGARICLTVWYPGLFRLCLKTLVAPFLPARLTAPGSPRMVHISLATNSISKPFCSVFCFVLEMDEVYIPPQFPCQSQLAGG